MIIGVFLMRLYEVNKMILEGYKEVTTKFSEDNDPQEVATVIEKYKELVNRNQFQGQERNIDWWGKQGYDKFKEAVRVKSLQKSMTQIKRSKNKGNSITLEENDKWLIVVPLDKDASCFHGKDTDWCTTKPFQTHFEYYFYNNEVTLLYFIRKSDLNKWAVAITDYNEEFYDKNDTNIGNGTFSEQTEIPLKNVMKLIDQVRGEKVQLHVNKSREKYHSLYDKIKGLIKNIKTGKHDYELEELLFKIKDKNLLSSYIYKVGKSDKYNKKLQMVAVSIDKSFIKFIENISKDVQMTAIKANGNVIQFIDNPDKDAQMAAVKQNGEAIQYIDNPDKDVQIAAVQKDGTAIGYINNPDKDVQLAAVRQNVSSLQYIIGIGIVPDKDVQMVAVQQDGDLIRFIYNPDKDVQMAAVKNNGYNKYTKSTFSPEVRRWAKDNGYIDEII